MDCAKKEEQDPEIEQAKKADAEQVRKGNYNYPGIRG
jgi:hypothetical protein